MPDRELTADAFWETVANRSRVALRAGGLQPVSTRCRFIEDRGVEFVVRVSDNLLRKRAAPAAYREETGANPFLPPEPGLTVGSLPPHHVAVLNKFNVLEQHVLVVTRGFAHQESPLTVDDFAAAAVGLAQGDGLAFYNAGETAGASQPHKHFQLVPRRLGRRREVPMEALFDAAASGIDSVPGLRFRHAFSRLDTPAGDRSAFARACREAYRDALGTLGLPADHEPVADARLPPYNLLLTDRWLFVAPRAMEHCEDVSVNGLGYAGSLFVSTAARLERVKALGPMTLLERVSIPRT